MNQASAPALRQKDVTPLLLCVQHAGRFFAKRLSGPARLGHRCRHGGVHIALEVEAAVLNVAGELKREAGPVAPSHILHYLGHFVRVYAQGFER